MELLPKTGQTHHPTIIERRENSGSTVFGNALDFSNSKDGYVKDVTRKATSIRLRFT